MFQFIQTNATPIIGFLTLLSNIIFIAVIVVILVHAGSRAKLYRFVHRHILRLLFVGILSAVIGSLVYSDIVGFLPCDLCWWQRIMLYPQAILILVAMVRKEKIIINYLMPLSVIGAAIALYQSFIQWGYDLGSLVGCASVGGECAKIYVKTYSYITIPFMSFSIFVYIIVLKGIYYHKEWKIKHGRE